MQTHRYWPGIELAERLGVSLRTLRRDIDRLRDLGYPVEAQRGVDGGYQLAAGAALPPLLLDDDEAVALGVGLHAAVQGDTVVGIAEASVRALAKLAQVMPSRLRRRVDALSAMTIPATWTNNASRVDAGDLISIAQACRDVEHLEFTYTARDGERTVRRVEPHRLVLLGRRWYLVAWDLNRDDWRSFRLDRVDEPHSTGGHFGPRELPTGDAAEFVRSGIDNLPAQHRVEVLMRGPSHRVRERIGQWVTVEAADEDTCLVRMTADSLDWAAMALGAAGLDFDVLAPPELLHHLREWAQRFNAANTTPEL